jgi:hypothetical protein
MRVDLQVEGRPMRCRTRFAITLPVLVLCAIARGAAQDAPSINNDPPRIIFATSPAVLIRIDGDPVYRDVDGTDLQRIVNTKSFIVREPSGTFYLKVRNGWMEAYLLTGDWTVAGAPPDDAGEALQRAVSASAVDLLEIGEPESPDSGRLATGPVPTIYVSTAPAALIVTDGPARFVSFPGTALEYVENTSAYAFKEPTDGELYVFTSERWYRSWTTDGPWEFVATRDLPADFAGISSASLKNSARPRATDQR